MRKSTKQCANYNRKQILGSGGMALVSTWLLAAVFVFLQSCTVVKPYQKSKINDSEMDLASRKAEKFEQSFYLYREGASGANGGKSGGGCGCN